MKKITTYLIALTIATFLFSCGGTDKNTNDEKATEQTTETEQVEVETEESGYTIDNFISESYKPEASIFNSEETSLINEGISEEQLIFIGNEYIPNIDEITCYKPVVFETPNYTTILLTYRDDANELANLITVDKNGKIISQKEEIYFFGERAESGSIEIEPSEDNTMFISCKQAVLEKIGNRTGLTTTFNYYKIDQNGELTKADSPLTFTDDRDGKTYKVVKIGDQFWLAENLAYKPNSNEAILSKHMTSISDLGNFWVYDDKEENIKKYGYLYNYKAAQKAVPNGWHLPTKTEFETLLNHYGEKPYSALTTDKEGLSIVFSGWYFGESAYVQEGEGVGFWSANKDDEDKEKALVCIIGRFDETSGYINISPRYMSDAGAAVRLIMDDYDVSN